MFPSPAPHHGTTRWMLVWALIDPLSTLLSPVQEARADCVYWDGVVDGSLTGGRLPLARIVPPATATPPVVPPNDARITTLFETGPSSNRCDVVFVGDGFQEDELDAYAERVDAFLPHLFRAAPFESYQTFFNAYRIDTPSIDSGVDHDPSYPTWRSTALDMGFWCSGLERLLCVDTAKVDATTSLAPDADIVFAVAHSTKYGGAGYPGIATWPSHTDQGFELALHELGHAWAGLGDEYDGPGTWNDGEPTAPNLSIFDAAELEQRAAKWWRWLPLDIVDAFVGGGGVSDGIHRPTSDSRMRTLGQPFGPVNGEALLLALARHVRLIDNASPPPGALFQSDTTLSVDVVHPSSHRHHIQWCWNGRPIAGADGETLDLSTLSLPAGLHTIEAHVIDPTDLIRDEAMRHDWLSDQRMWTVAEETWAPGTYLSVAEPTLVGPWCIEDGDIVHWCPTSKRASLCFDASDVLEPGFDVDALALAPDGTLLLSFRRGGLIEDLQAGPDGDRIEDEDLVRFHPTRLGQPTRGSFEFAFDGSDVGLAQRSTLDLDALSLTENGDLLISLSGPWTLQGHQGRDEDLLRFEPIRLGATTDGTWTPWFDGSKAHLGSPPEDIDAVDWDPTALADRFERPNHRWTCSTNGSHRVPGVRGGRGGDLLERWVEGGLAEEGGVWREGMRAADWGADAAVDAVCVVRGGGGG